MPRTINDIIPPSRRRPVESDPQSQPMPQQPATPSASVPPPYQPPMHQSQLIIPRRRFPWGTALFTLIVIILVAGALYAFAGAKIEITPTENPLTLSGNFTATPQSGSLPFETVTVEKVASTSVPAESTSSVQQSAQGTITIYNTQDTDQPLITNTRFESPDGHIYRIHAPIDIPAGTASAPGQITATVYADAPGADYNIAPTTFTVPGLQGTDAYSEVTAKSSVAMAGGFSGERGTVSSATDDATHAKLQTALITSIQAAVTAQVPSGYVLIPGATFTTYAPQPDGVAADGSVVVSETADATAVVFPSTALASAIAAQAVSGYGGQPVTLNDASGLSLAQTASSTDADTDDADASSTAPDSSSPFTFTLSGTTTIVWTVDPTKIAGAVAGKTRADAQSALGSFPEVSKAELILRPFWSSTFPTDPSKITVTVDNPS